MSKTDVLERCNRAIHAAREVLDEADEANRELTVEESQKCQRAVDAYVQYQARMLQPVEAVDVDGLSVRTYMENANALPLPEVATKRDTDTEKLLSTLRGKKRGVSMELDTHQVRLTPTGKLEQRRLTVGTAADGGNLVPEGFLAQLYAYRETYSGYIQSGPTTIRTMGGEDLPMPVVTAHTIATTAAEAATIGGTEPTFGQVVMKAHKLAVLVNVSNELIQDNGVDLIGFVASNAARALAFRMDLLGITGSGSAEPQGVLVGAGTGHTGGTGVKGVATMDDLITLQYSVNAAYQSTCSWLMHQSTAGHIARLKDTQGQYLWQQNKAMGEPNMLLGKPVYLSDNMPALGTGVKSVIYGSWVDGVVSREAGSMVVDTATEYLFANDQFALRAKMRWDSKVRDTSAVKVFRGGAS